jgi:hypothetical protein
MSARLPGMLAAALLAGVAVLYVAIILGQGDQGHGDRVAFFASAIVTAALLAAGGALARDPYWRRLQFGIAAFITFVCAWLAALSIGPLFWLPLLVLVFAVIRG